MKLIKDISISIFLLTFSFCCVYITLSIKKSIDSITSEITQTTAQTREEVVNLRKDVFKYLYDTTNILDKRVGSIEVNTLNRIESIEKNTFSSLSEIEKNINQISNEVVLLSGDFRKIPQTIGKLEPYLDCENNDFCWQNLTTDSLISFRNVSVDSNKTFLTINEHVPLMTQNFTNMSKIVSEEVPKIVVNSSEITKNVNRLTKPRWYDRLISIGANGSLIWFNINRSMIRQ